MNRTLIVSLLCLLTAPTQGQSPAEPAPVRDTVTYVLRCSSDEDCEYKAERAALWRYYNAAIPFETFFEPLLSRTRPPPQPPRPTTGPDGSPARFLSHIHSIDLRKGKSEDGLPLVILKVECQDSLGCTPTVSGVLGSFMACAAFLFPDACGPMTTEATSPTLEKIKTARQVPNRPSLGLSFIRVTEETAYDHNLAPIRGALVTRLTPGGAAERAGLQVNDVIFAFDGKPVRKLLDIPLYTFEAAPNSSVTLHIQRQGVEKAIRVTF